MQYGFYGSDTPDVHPIGEYSAVKNQRHLYELLEDLWTKDNARKNQNICIFLLISKICIKNIFLKSSQSYYAD